MSKETTREQAARVQATSRFRPSDFEDEDAWRFAYEEAISNFLAGCEHEAKRDKWVSVKELPDKNDAYLVRYEDESFDVAVYHNGWDLIRDTVTHWQPLPEPPKEESE